jgi:DNA repair ATPase RecN
MQVLGMPGSVFKVDLPKKENGVHYNGDESVDFLVRTNKFDNRSAFSNLVLLRAVACWWYCCAKVSFCCCRPSNEALAPLRACRDCAMLSMLSSAQVQTQETIYELNNYLSSLSFDEQTTAELEARLSELHDLARSQTIDCLNNC